MITKVDVANYVIHSVNRVDPDEEFSVSNSTIQLVDTLNSFTVSMDRPNLSLPISQLYVSNSVKLHMSFHGWDTTLSELGEMREKYKSDKGIDLDLYRVEGACLDKFYRTEYQLSSLDWDRSMNLSNIPERFLDIPIGSYLLIGIESNK